MTPERWQQVKEVLNGALELDPEQRPAYLDQICSTDDSLRRDVDILLSSAENSSSDLLSFISTKTTPFSGTARFRVVRRLGEGGMGVVYEAEDVALGTRVALKTLRAFSADALLRFKKEFRALAGIQHPNLVRYHGLFEDRGQWFFSMELVEGTNFLSFVRPGGSQPAICEETMSSCPFDEHRLRNALAQLARAVHFLHEHGKVHRDIKPSNIRITSDGRVILLDFGLIVESPTETARTMTDSQQGIVGTIAYMAPEQAASQTVGPPTDWYAVGVALYEALTGRVPFLGSPLEVLLNKQRLEPTSARTLNRLVPEDLDALCRELLRIDPNARPDGASILEALGAPVEAPLDSSDPSILQRALFVGRSHEIKRLRDALTDSRANTLMLLCEGESGIGKSTLLDRFRQDIESTAPGTVVLAGRCYEREAVPFKAVDGIIDALSRYLARLPEAEAAALLPRYAGLLAQTFPVLQHAGAFETAPFQAGTLDAQERRMRVFASLRELFERLASRRALVLVIDDLQWADADSLTLLEAVLQPPDAPRLLLVASVRTPSRSLGLPGEVRRLEVTSLLPDEATELARMLSQRTQDRRVIDAAAIAAEANGHPLYVHELVRHVLEGRGGRVQLDEALAARVARLGTRERQLLEIIAVAGAPTATSVAATAAGLTLADLVESVTQLRMTNLVRTASTHGSNLMECYHDRVSESVTRGLSQDRACECNRRLALALEAQGGADHEALATHWQAAGDFIKAATYAEKAALKASAQLAFDRVAHLLALAIELGHADAIALRARLAEALANAGRGKEAADAYLASAEHAEGADALEYRRRAAEQLLISGHIEPGLEVVRTVLRAIGMKLPETPRAALLMLLWERAQIRVRGYRYTPRNESSIARKQLVRVDTCSAIAMSLGDVDTLRGAAFQSRSLRLALAAGETRRATRALALEAIFRAIENPGSLPVVALRKAAMAAATRLGEPYLLAWCDAIAGVDAYQEGAFCAAVEYSDRASDQWRTCPGATLEIDNGAAFALWALYYLGRWAEMGRRIPPLLAEARRRDNVYMATNLTTGILGAMWLAKDDAASARASVAQAEKVWARQPGWWHIQHYFIWLAALQLELYEGRPCFERAVSFWAGLERSFLLRIAVVHVEAFHAHARAALAEARTAKHKAAALVSLARADAMRFARDRVRYAAPMANLILAGADAVEGKIEAGLLHLEKAIAEFTAVEMDLFAAVSRWRKGELLGGDEGRALVAQADEFMRGQGIAKPERIASLLAPGFPV
jgi:serine/threonine protein kinase